MHKIGLKGTVDYMPDVYGFTYYSNTTPSNFPTTPMAVSLGGTSRLLWKYAVTYTITL